MSYNAGNAIAYFTGQIATHPIEPLHKHIGELAYKKKVKRYVHHLRLTSS